MILAVGLGLHEHMTLHAEVACQCQIVFQVGVGVDALPRQRLIARGIAINMRVRVAGVRGQQARGVDCS